MTAESAMVAVGAPFFLVAARRMRGGLRRALCAAGPLLLVFALSLAIRGIADDAGRQAGAFAWAQVFLLSFALLLWGFATGLARLGARPTAAQAAATLVGLAMVGNLFYANPFIEAHEPGPGKLRAVKAALWTNPWVIALRSILEEDPLQTEGLYAVTVVHWYDVRYPGTEVEGTASRVGLLSGAYAASALVVWGLSWLALGVRRGAGRAAARARGPRAGPPAR
ncbi:MAG: hypothetical protein ACLF0G_04540 [Candidatus Brocadiia bacterium]